MPCKAKVEVEEAVAAICHFGDCLSAELPNYTSKFYQDVSLKLDNKWSAHNIYTHLRENRRNLKSIVFQKLGIIEKIEAKSDSAIVTNDSTVEFLSEEEEDDDDYLKFCDDESLFFAFSSSDPNLIFDLCIRHDLWEKIKPVSRIYNGREDEVLQPGVWTDIVADEWWRQYRFPCAFSFKQAKICRNMNLPFVKIKGKCKSEKCGNIFIGIIAEEPCGKSDAWVKVNLTKDTRSVHHEEVKRQLRNEKRHILGRSVIREGASNLRRKIAAKEQCLGDMQAPILYEGYVLRKLAQEVNDKEIGVDNKDGNDPILILKKLKYKPPYAGNIGKVGADPFELHYVLKEQIFIYKEYCRLFKNNVSVCIDSTGSLALPMKIDEHTKSPAIFLYEIVINCFNTTVSVGQMLSAAHDTNTILFFLNSWFLKVKISPQQSVSDYSRALLAAQSLSFNSMPLTKYIRKCFSALQNNQVLHRPAPTYLRIDVAHFMMIFCRLKCFTPEKKAVKDFLLRCLALLVSSDDFERFEEILLLILTLTAQVYDGKIENSQSLSPAETARNQLLKYISEENHNAIALVPDETSEEFSLLLKKMSASGLDVDNPNCFLNQEPEADMPIAQWLTAIKNQSLLGSNTKHERVNAYFLLPFHKHLLKFAPEFVLWSGVMRKFFNSQCIRATSCFVEGDFGEFKNSVLKRVVKSIRADKLFIYHFEALKGQVMIASAAITSFLSENADNFEIPDVGKSTETDNANLFNSDLCEVENWRNKIKRDESFMELEILTSTADNKDESEGGLQQNIFESSTPKKSEIQKNETFVEKPIELLKNDPLVNQKQTQQNLVEPITSKHSKIRKLQPTDRNPSKYFKACPDIEIQQKATASGLSSKKFSTKSKKWLLKNGCTMSEKPSELNGELYSITLTCPFDSIVQILASAATDYNDYFNFIENSFNETCQFLLVLIDSGAENHVYVQRCSVLKNFLNRLHPDTKSLFTAKRGNCVPKVLHNKRVDCNVTEMWQFLMSNEPSLRNVKSCECGFSDVREISSLFVNHSLIEQKGFNILENAIIHDLHPLDTCECGTKMNHEITVNSHVFIETDVRTRANIQVSLKCKVTDFPVDIVLYGQKLRLVGVIIYDGVNHYMAACRKINKQWELYDDTKNDVPLFNVRCKIIPHGVIYIKV